MESLVYNQRCREALIESWEWTLKASLVDSGLAGGERSHPHIGSTSSLLFLFEFFTRSDAWGCWRSLCWGSVSVWVVRLTAATKKKKLEDGDWHHPKHQMMWTGNHAAGNPEKINRVLDAPPPHPPRVKSRSWVGIQNERPVAYYIAFNCLLYCILLSTGFTVR